MAVTIRVRREQCAAVMACMAIAPDALDLDDESVISVVDASSTSDEDLLAAARACPMDAIEVYDGATMVWPDGAG